MNIPFYCSETAAGLCGVFYDNHNKTGYFSVVLKKIAPSAPIE
jgi:hypothetical protein